MKFSAIACLFCFLRVVCIANGEEGSTESSAQNEVEARVIGITESAEPASKLKDGERRQKQFIENGYCHWGIKEWYEPGSHMRCNCMKCTCVHGGIWNCSFFFNYCPQFYCGNEIYDPSTELCCCGKRYTKRDHFQCCGYFYYNTKTSKCCHFYSVKPSNASCPKHRV